MAEKKKTVRRQVNVIITYKHESLAKDKRINVSISNAAKRILDPWNNERIIDMFIRFSVAHGGPDEFLAAWEHWGQVDECGRGSAAIEAAIWWGEGYGLHLRTKIEK